MFKPLIQNYFTFKPNAAIAEDISAYNLTNVNLDSGYGKIHLVHNQIKPTGPVIFFSHGNASCLESLAPTYDFYNSLEVSFLAYDYPGYGKSEGTPSEAALYESCQLAYEYLSNELAVSEDRIIPHGLSLGGVPTVELLVRVPFKKAILEATFTSAKAMANYKFPLVPFITYLADGFDSLSKIPNVQSEILFIHGELDQTIPFSHSCDLNSACNSSSYFYLIPNCGHADQKEVGGKAYFNVWRKFLDSGVAGLEQSPL